MIDTFFVFNPSTLLETRRQMPSMFSGESLPERSLSTTDDVGSFWSSLEPTFYFVFI